MSVGLQVREDELRHLMENVWCEMLFADVQPFVNVGAGPGLTWHGFVEVLGDWHGFVCLECSDEAVTFVRDALAADHRAAPGDREDAFLELVNILGGGVKSLADGSCRLELPRLGIPEGCGGGTVIDEVYRCAGAPVRIRILAAG